MVRATNNTQRLLFTLFTIMAVLTQFHHAAADFGDVLAALVGTGTCYVC
jgi:hypothetical protein